MGEQKILKLEFLGQDSWDRPVYKTESGSLVVDVDPRKDHGPDLCTKFKGLDSRVYPEPCCVVLKKIRSPALDDCPTKNGGKCECWSVHYQRMKIALFCGGTVCRGANF